VIREGRRQPVADNGGGKALMIAAVDQDTCVGCGLCAETCEAVFEMADNVARVIADQVPEEFEEDCREAAESCPVEAITIEE
jgi:ferredoxin